MGYRNVTTASRVLKSITDPNDAQKLWWKRYLVLFILAAIGTTTLVPSSDPNSTPAFIYLSAALMAPIVIANVIDVWYYWSFERVILNDQIDYKRLIYRWRRGIFLELPTWLALVILWHVLNQVFHG